MLRTVVLAVSVAAAGCVSHQMYRETSVVELADYTLVFIEFDDHGEIWSPKQFFEFQKVIRKANEHELGAVVTVLAHGWNNDASPANEREGTLASYKQTLQGIAERTHAAAPGRPVVGVYLGWRGQSMRGPLKYFTFFSRQRAADRVVGTQSAAVVGQIVLERKANPASNLLLIGHSFGGLFAIHALIERPDSFDAYIAISPSLWWADGVVVDRAELLFASGGELGRKTLFMSLANEGDDMYAQYRTEYESYIRQNVAAFVTGQKDVDADWDGYVKGLEAIGLDEYLAIVQAAYDGMK